GALMFQNRYRLFPVAAAIVVAVVCGPRLSARQAGRAAAASDVNGFKVGDVVDVDTAFGWTDATIVAGNGNNYQVRTSQGVVVMKMYPLELHRKGAYTDRDHAVGLYALKDIVQVNITGK